MVLNKDKYIIQKPYIKIWLDAIHEPRYLDEIGSIALATNVPIIIVTQYVIDLYGSSDELEGFKTRLMKFYGVDEVV